jgi:CheY-like chemotaxis protein
LVACQEQSSLQAHLRFRDNAELTAQLSVFWWFSKVRGRLRMGDRRDGDPATSDTLAEATCLNTDLQMPGLSSLELQEALRSQGYQTPVIVITA